MRKRKEAKKLSEKVGNRGRKENENAIMLLTVDSEVEKGSLKKLRSLDQINWAYYLDLSI